MYFYSTQRVFRALLRDFPTGNFMFLLWWLYFDSDEIAIEERGMAGAVSKMVVPKTSQPIEQWTTPQSYG